jgi:hypothetical protein
MQFKWDNRTEPPVEVTIFAPRTCGAVIVYDRTTPLFREPFEELPRLSPLVRGGEMKLRDGVWWLSGRSNRSRWQAGLAAAGPLTRKPRDPFRPHPGGAGTGRRGEILSGATAPGIRTTCYRSAEHGRRDGMKTVITLGDMERRGKSSRATTPVFVPPKESVVKV